MSALIELDPRERPRFGVKGVVLAELRRLGLPVPAGFSIAAEAADQIPPCADRLPASLEREVRAAVAAIEAQTGKRFGDPVEPLLLSVRSGAGTSMPGILGTVLDVGISDATFAALATRHGRRFALDCKVRLLRSFGEVVLGISSTEHGGSTPFVELIDHVRQANGGLAVSELPEQELERLVAGCEALLFERLDRGVPSDPWEQLSSSICGVFATWHSPAAKHYREHHQIPERPATAVTICAMVYGNLDERSATGVIFSRDPNTGENVLYGEYLPRAQGDELVSGVGSPLPIDAHSGSGSGDTLEKRLPEVYRTLASVTRHVEQHYRAPQELEFTVQSGELWVLQARDSELAPRAKIRATVELLDEGLIDPAAALRSVRPADLAPVIPASLAPEAPRTVIAKGLPAAPGLATGKIALDSHEAEKRAKRGEAVILVRGDASPEDVPGIRAAKGVLTARGGTTCHAAVIARALGRVAVVSAKELVFDLRARTVTARGKTLAEGERITIDGRTGEVLLGAPDRTTESTDGHVSKLLAIADRLKSLQVRAVVRRPSEASEALRSGAEGLVVEGAVALVRSDLETILRAAGEKPLALILGAHDAANEARVLRALVEAAMSAGRAAAIELILAPRSPGELAERTARAEEAVRAQAGLQLTLQISAVVSEPRVALPSTVRRVLALDEGVPDDLQSESALLGAWGASPPAEAVVRVLHDAGARFIAGPLAQLPALRLLAGRVATPLASPAH